MIIHKSRGNTIASVSCALDVTEQSITQPQQLKKLTKENITFLQAIGFKVCPRHLS